MSFRRILAPLTIASLAMLASRSEEFVHAPLAPAAARSTAPSPTAEDAAVQRIVAGIIARHRIPAFGGVIVRSSGQTALAVSGVRRLGAPSRVTPGERRHIGSNTKAVTALAIARLVDQALLSWNSTPAAVFPEFAMRMHPRLRRASLEQLLSHRAAIRQNLLLVDWNSLPPFPGKASQQRLAYALRVLGDTPTARVGRFAYSNAGYTVAAAMAERASADSWEHMLARRVFRPLGMAPSFGWPGLAGPEQPWGYYPSGESLIPLDPQSPLRIPAFVAPAGDVSLSLGDFGIFLQANLRALRGLSSPFPVATIRRLHTDSADDGSFYGLGWLLLAAGDGSPISTHDGSTDAFYTSADIHPTKNVALAFATNAGGGRAEAAMQDAFAQVAALVGGT